MINKIKIPIKRSIRCPFCSRIHFNFTGELTTSNIEGEFDKIKIIAKCKCGFHLKKKYVVVMDSDSELEIKRISNKLFNIWDKIRLTQQRKKEDSYLKLTDKQKMQCRINHALNDKTIMMSDEFMNTGRIASKL